MNRKGMIVKEYSHASRQAKVPKQSTCSNIGGSMRKFMSLSIFTRDDSYGNSFDAGR
jgi:hypothetical protein